MLILTGQRQHRRHLVYVHGTPVWVTGAEFDALCEMVRARNETDSGMIRLARLIAWRIRHEIDIACGQPGLGKSLIILGAGEEFSLSCHVQEIGWTPCFRELNGRGFVNEKTIESILKTVREVKLF